MSSPPVSSELTSYRSINPWAIAALLGGVASPLALVNELLIAVPLAGVFLALLALRNIARDNEVSTGLGFARAGLFLCTLFLAFVPAQITFRIQRMRESALELADETVRLLQAGRGYEVHHLTSRRFAGRDQSRDLAEYYAEDPKLLEVYKRFIEAEPLKRLLDPPREYTFERQSLETSWRDDGDSFVARYRIVPNDHAQSAFEVWVVVRRLFDQETRAPVWWLRSVLNQDPAKHK